MSTYLTDLDRPHLSGFASLIPQGNGVVVHDTQSGASFVLNATDAQVVRSCNGVTTVAELVQAHGTRAQYVLGQLLAAELLLTEPLRAEVTVTAERTGDDEGDAGTITEMPPGAAPIITAPTVSVRPSLQQLPKVPVRSSPPSLPVLPPRPSPSLAQLPERNRPTREPMPLGKGGSVAGMKSPIAPGWDWPQDPPSAISKPDLPEPLTKPEGRRAQDLVLSLKPTRAERVKMFAPWVLLVVVVVVGTAYHRATVAELKALRDEVHAVAKPAVAPAQRMVRLAAKDVLEVAAGLQVPVKKVPVTKGQLVKKNAVLVELDDSKARAELQEAVAKSKDAAKQRAKIAARVPQHASREDLETFTQKAEAAAAEVKRLAEKLDDYKLRSPIEGTVLEITVKPGDTPGTDAVAKVADLSVLIIDLEIPERDAKNLVAGSKAEVAPQNGEGKPAAAVVVGLTAAAGVAVVRIQLKASEAWLKPDALATVTFPEGGTPGAVEAASK